MNYTELQIYTDNLFKSFLEAPDDVSIREIYKNDLNKLESTNRGDVNKIFGYRKDKRSLGEFALNIYDNTALLERNCFNFWAKNYGKKHFENFDFKPSGIDQDGKLIWGKTKEEVKTPDYYSKNNDCYLEIKYSPCDFKNTFKTYDFEYYNSLGNVYVLSVTCKTYNATFNENAFSQYLLISPDEISTICSDLKNGKLLSYPCVKEYKGKPGFQFYFYQSDRNSRITRGSLSATSVFYKDYCKTSFFNNN